MSSHRAEAGPCVKGKYGRAAMLAMVLTVSVVGLATVALVTLAAGATRGADPASPALTAAASTRTGTVFFEGDSLTSRYGDVPGFPDQGYWSKLARQLGERSVIDAQGGSGFVKPGSRVRHPARGHLCDGSTFQQRLTAQVGAEVERADAVVIEGGRNDFHTCGSDGSLTPVTAGVIRAAVDGYLDRIAALRSDEDPATVYVMTPWGAHLDARHRHLMVPIVRRQTRLHGFSWIDTDSVLDPHRLGENTLDGIHPDARGTEAMVLAILEHSDIAERIGSAQAARAAP